MEVCGWPRGVVMRGVLWHKEACFTVPRLFPRSFLRIPVIDEIGWDARPWSPEPLPRPAWGTSPQDIRKEMANQTYGGYMLGVAEWVQITLTRRARRVKPSSPRSSIMSIQLVAPEKGSLPERTPNLMPFNIKYTGTAPVSTYFRPKPPPVQADPPTSVEAGGSQEGTSQLSTTTDAANPAESNTDPVTTLNAVPKEEPLVAAFRGRTVRGTRTSVPDGYTGVVLIGADANKTKQPSPSLPPPGRRPSRRSGRVIHIDEDDEPQDVDMDGAGEDVDGYGQGEEEEAPTRTLTLASVFSSFVVWNSDIPVDEGRDEYIRSLNEWTKLSAMVCHSSQASRSVLD